MVLRMLPGPILAWLGMLMFMLVMQFLIKYLPDLVGKGLPVLAVTELVAYNLAYMLVLAVPMSVLIASLMSFGRLAESGTFSVIKGAGVSFLQLVWPVFLVGLLMTLAMGYFNNVVLPEANFRARNLWQDIRVARPGFQLKPGVFYDGLNDYKILVRHIPPDSPNELHDVTIYDYTEGSRYRVDIKAKRGRLETVAGGTMLEILLNDGEIHRLRPPGSGNDDRYERLGFKRHRMLLSLDDLSFERSDPTEGRRTDRTMRTADMVGLVDSLVRDQTAAEGAIAGMLKQLGTRDPDPNDPTRGPISLVTSDSDALPTVAGAPALALSPWRALQGLDKETTQNILQFGLQDARSTHTRLERNRRIITSTSDRADRYRVEIHKKYSIALACLIFMLVGVPLGLRIRRGGLATAALLALGIFMFYWVTLVNGEKFADRGYIEPWLGMWGANIVMGIVGLWFMRLVYKDKGSGGFNIPFLNRRPAGQTA
ncbi:MAG: lipopolysaccharide export system permease protein [Rhodothermales bacterium]|jgi:lipopolysaccharide export system permease protein